MQDTTPTYKNQWSFDTQNSKRSKNEIKKTAY